MILSLKLKLKPTITITNTITITSKTTDHRRAGPKKGISISISI